MISVEEAVKQIILSKIFPGTETIPIENASGRILAEDIFADRDYPPFNRAAMDGYTINSQDFLEKKMNVYEIAGEIYAGDSKYFILKSGQAIKIMTGAAVPGSLDTVIRKEDTEVDGSCVSIKLSSVKKFQNISLRGEDLRGNDQVLNKNSQINFSKLPLLASLGKNKIKVYRTPNVAIISTGNEIKPIDSPVSLYQIRDSNSITITRFLDQYKIESAVNIIVQDKPDLLISAIESVMDKDVIIISGGVSAGDADFVPQALTKCGVKEIFHKVRIKPGKPIWFGKADSGVCVFALPGNPFSVQAACKVFIEPFIRATFNLSPVTPFILPFAANRKKKIKLDEYLPAKLLNKPNLMVDIIPFNGSGDITAIINSNGLIHHPADGGEINYGDEVIFYPWKNIL